MRNYTCLSVRNGCVYSYNNMILYCQSISDINITYLILLPRRVDKYDVLFTLKNHIFFGKEISIRALLFCVSLCVES